jgi:hypothetical protein
VKDGSGQKVAYVYYEEEPGQASDLAYTESLIEFGNWCGAILGPD